MPIIEDNERFIKHQQDKSLLNQQNERIILDGTTELKLKLVIRELERAMAEIDSLKAVIANG